jgi:phosphatidylinositol 4-kinase
MHSARDSVASRSSRHSAAAQIAAMEAKLAMMQRKKPADETWVPGQKFGALPPGTSGASTREGTGPPGRAGSRAPSEDVDSGMDIEEELGLLEGAKAADDLEREMARILAGSEGVGDASANADVGANAAESRDTSAERRPRSPLPSARPDSLPRRPAAKDAPVDAAPVDEKARKKAEEAARKNAETIQRGFAMLPRKPAFL